MVTVGALKRCSVTNGEASTGAVAAGPASVPAAGPKLSFPACGYRLLVDEKCTEHSTGPVAG